MILNGAINLNETTDYIVYTMNSVTTGQYGVVVPKNINGTLNMLVDLHMKGSFDGVSNGIKTKDQLVSEISEEYNKLKTKYVDGMLVMPMIDETMFQNAVINNDKQKMFDEVKKIGAITSELYKKLTEAGVEKQKIDQKIIIVEKNQDDEKFVEWLKVQMPNFVDGLLYSELNATQEMVNPFVDSNNIFEPAQQEAPKVEEPVVETPVNNEVVSENVTPVVPAAPVVEASVNPVPEIPADIFGTPVTPEVVKQPEVSVTTPDTTVVATQSTPVENKVVENTVVSAPVTPVETATPAVEVEGPKPVDRAALDGTIAFTPIPNHPNNPVAEENNTNVPAAEKGSKGFANLLILLVVLVAVTLISIELGKFLYSVYGA